MIVSGYNTASAEADDQAEEIYRSEASPIIRNQQAVIKRA